MRLLGLLVVLLTAGVVGAPAASAHGVGGVAASNWLSEILSVGPAMPGVQVRLTNVGEDVELTNSSSQVVTVLGYDGEPYLRISATGVEQNRRSAATYLNRTVQGTDPIPADVDPKADPDWVRVADGPTYAWHDHRTHWMLAKPPPAVDRAPLQRQVISTWKLDFVYGATPVAVNGQLSWVPGPSPAPWAVLAVLLAAACWIVAGLRAWRLPVIIALAVLVESSVVHVVGGGRSGSTFTVATGWVLDSLSWALAAWTVWALLQRKKSAPYALIVSALLVAVASGLTDLTELTRSQLPFTWPTWLARLCVTAVAGLGVGLALAGWRVLRREQPLPPRTRAAVVDG